MRSVALHCGVSYVSQEIALGHGTYEEMWTFENGLSWNHSGLELNKLRTGVLSRAGEGVSRQERHRADRQCSDVLTRCAEPGKQGSPPQST